MIKAGGDSASISASLCELDRIVDQMIGNSTTITSGNQQQMARQLMAIGTAAASAVGLGGGPATAGPLSQLLMSGPTRVPAIRAMPYTR